MSIVVLALDHMCVGSGVQEADATSGNGMDWERYVMP
jgi:hypothetical protein